MKEYLFMCINKYSNPLYQRVQQYLFKASSMPKSMLILCAGLFSLSLSLLSQMTHAQDTPDAQKTKAIQNTQIAPARSTQSTPVSYRAEILTDLPLQIGLNALVEFDSQWRLSTSLGYMPQGYVALTNKVVMMIPNTYEEPTAELIEDTIQNSLVWRAMAGWSPKSYGFYTHIGYALATLGGGASTVALIEGITGQEVNTSNMNAQNNEDREKINIDAASDLHMFSLELGWEWKLSELAKGRWLTLRTALGWSYTFSSSAVLSADTADRRPFVQKAYDRLETAGENYLLDTFDTYVHPPTLSIAIGYQWD